MRRSQRPLQLQELPLLGAFNLSSNAYLTNRPTMAVLNAGLKFVPTPEHCTTTALATHQFQAFARKVRLRHEFGEGSYNPRYHVPAGLYEPPAASPPVEAFLEELEEAVMAFFVAPFRTPHSNMQQLHRAALRWLKGDASLVVKPSDKNLGLVVMDAADYQGLIQQQLQDPGKFLRVTEPHSDVLLRVMRHYKQLLALWRFALPEHVYKYLSAWADSWHDFPTPYCLPKLHKLPQVTREYLPQLKGRLIVPSHSWWTHAASVYMADVLNAACQRRFPHVLPDSRTLIKALEGVQVSSSALLVTFDVVDMYPSISNACAIQAAVTVAPGSLRGVVNDFLHFIMGHSYCLRDGQLYQQLGTAMGTSCAPPYANIYFAQCVEEVLRREFADFPKHYFRLIDDGLFIWEGPRDRLDALLHRMNTLLPNISITWQVDSVKVPYLDVWVCKGATGSGPTVPIYFSTYQKQHNKYMYVPYTSHHRPCVFKAIIKGELVRYAVTCTQVAAYQSMCLLFKQRLLQRGYPAALFDAVQATVQHADRDAYLHNPGSTRRRIGAAAPVYIAQAGPREGQGNLSAVINGVYAKHKQGAPALAAIFGERIVVAYKNPPSIGKLLVHAKD